MKTLGRVSVLCTLLLLWITVAQSAVIQVPSEMPTIQAGINAAINGDTVLVADGTYSGVGNRDISFNGKQITVASNWGPEGCIIDCQGSVEESHRGFHFNSGENALSVLSGFTITNGYYSEYYGGAIRVESGSSPTINYCMFSNCHAYCGGAIHAVSADISVSTSVFIGNSSEQTGGAVQCSTNTGKFEDCLFRNNHSRVGGAFYGSGSSTDFKIINCEFDMNTADLHGGAISFVYNTTVTIEKCVFTGNEADHTGGAIHFMQSCSAVIGGSEGQGNFFSENFAGSGTDLGISAISLGTPIIATWNNFTGFGYSDYYCSPPTGFDLANSTYNTTPITQDIFVSPYGDDTNDGLTEETPFQTIHHAMRQVFAEETNPITIHLDEGEYSPSATGEIFQIPMVNFVTISGMGKTKTILNAEYSGRHFFFNSDENSILRNLTIKGGQASHGGSIQLHAHGGQVEDCRITDNHAINEGGAIYFYGATPIFQNCEISHNTSGSQGGGVYCGDSSEPIFVNCDLTFNQSYYGGGGFACNLFGHPRFYSCRIMNNSSEYHGGGLYLGAKGITTTITDCIISGNSTNRDGGGIYAGWASSPYIYNSLITNNTALEEGGGIYLSSDNWSEIRNCTITRNSASAIGGIHSANDTHLIVADCILWGDIPDEIEDTGPYVSVTYSDIQGGHAGEGNINADPMFVNGPSGKFYLSQTSAGQPSDSPCVDAGGNTSAKKRYPYYEIDLCMDTLTTRTDHISDAGIVDMGYHYDTEFPTCIHSGDVNFDGEITAGDAQIAFLITMGVVIPTIEEFCAADFNDNGSVSAGDAQLIFEAALGR